MRVTVTDVNEPPLAVTVLVVKLPVPIDHENAAVLVAAPEAGIVRLVGDNVPAAPPPLVSVTLTLVPMLETIFPHWSVTLTEDTNVGPFPVSLHPNVQLTEPLL